MTDRPTTLNDACDHKIADHHHGTRACYTLDGCRCSECHEARRRYDWHRAKWLGDFPQIPPPRVDAEPLRQRVRGLMDQGMGLKRVAEVSGVSTGALSKLMCGNYKGSAPSKTVSRRNAERLRAVELDLADGTSVNATEAWQIVNELVARGWAKAEIGRRISGPSAVSLQMGEGLVFAGTLRTLRTLLNERVPERTHNPTGKRYTPDTGHRWQNVPATTAGVPDDFTPGSPTWIRVMRDGLRTALEDARRRNAA